MEGSDIRIGSIFDEDFGSSTGEERREFVFERVNKILNLVIREFFRFRIEIKVEIKLTTTRGIFTDAVMLTMFFGQHKERKTRIGVAKEVVILRAINSDKRKIRVERIKRSSKRVITRIRNKLLSNRHVARRNKK